MRRADARSTSPRAVPSRSRYWPTLTSTRSSPKTASAPGGAPARMNDRSADSGSARSTSSCDHRAISLSSSVAMRSSTAVAIPSRKVGAVTGDTRARSRSPGAMATKRYASRRWVRSAAMADTTKKAHQAGRGAVSRLRKDLAQRVADLLQRDPERLGRAVELGLIRREWLEDPGAGPVTAATPVGVIARALERSVEQKPSMLAALGLSAIQILSSGADDPAGEGTPTPLTVV